MGLNPGNRNRQPDGRAHERSQQVERVILGFAVALILGVVVGAWFAGRALDADDVEPLTASVEAVAAESRVVTEDYLGHAQTGAQVVERVLNNDPDLLRREVQLLLLLLTVDDPTFDGFFVGNGDGDFVHATKGLAVEPGGLRLRIITNGDAAGRTVTDFQYNADLQLVSEESSSSTYDPRTRPWYRSAIDLGDGWTEPYSFAASGADGITYFRRLDDFDTNGTVLGVDLRLNELTSFLSDRQLGPNGVAALVTSSGAVIAGSNAPSSDLVLPALASGETRTLAAAHGATGGQSITAHSFVSADSDWRLVVSALDADLPDALGAPIARVRAATPWVATGLILLVALLASLSISRIRQVHRQATVDSETGLATRAAIHAALEQQLQGRQRFLAIGITIDPTGLAAGSDPLASDLTAVVDTLERFVGPGGQRGRTGSREFLVLQPIDGERHVGRLPGELFEALRDVVQCRSANEQGNSLAIGWTLVEPAPSVALESVIRDLDLALIVAEASPQALVQYTQDLQPSIVADERRRRELGAAIESGEFCTEFQPEIDLRTGRVVGAEALLRRSRPTGDPEIADRFIDDLERLGLITRLTHLVLDETADFALRWKALPEFVIRLNLSAAEVNDPSIIARLERMSASDGHQWCIELTERTIESLDENAVEGLRRLVHSGVDIALDDFGTGYSSMGELKRLPITTLKIDRSFVEPLETAHGDIDSVASLIESVASRLGLDLVAEGIETEAQRRALIELGCSRGQGWLMAPSLSPNDFVTFVQARSASNNTKNPTTCS